jgi:predicted DNA repair protein MutK
VSTGLLALLDDVVGMAKVAAGSLDDVAAQATRAGVKAAGVVIDDAAVTPRYVVGFAAAREIPIVRRIAIGSLRNKLLFLLPAALLLSALAPWLITPLVVLGGAFLCYEGAEKVYEALFPHAAHAHEVAVGAAPADPQALEDAKVQGAIRTDFILSAEIMAITLSSITTSSLVMQAAVLAAVGIGTTAIVYGAVALIVKADDIGLSLSRSSAGAVAALGRGLVKGMPPFLKLLSIVGTAAMLWVGGGIIIHGLHEFGLHAAEDAMHAVSHAAQALLPAISGFAGWLAGAALSGVFGLLVGVLLIPVVGKVLAPVAQWLGAVGGRTQPH